MLNHRRPSSASLAADVLAMSVSPLRAQAPAGPVTVLTIIDVVQGHATPHNVEAADGLLANLAEDTQRAPGVLSFKVLRNASRSNHFIMLAVWNDTPSFEAYSGGEATRRFRRTSISCWTTIPVTRRWCSSRRVPVMATSSAA